MKPTFYLILILFFCNLIVAQESFPNLDDKPSWKVVNTITSNPETKTLFEYQFEKDTLINSVTYQKITNNAGYVRLLNDKVYYRLKSNSKDFLLYDLILFQKVCLSHLKNIVFKTSLHRRLDKKQQ